MKLNKIIEISVNIKRIKNLTDDEYIIEAVNNIQNILQEEINSGNLNDGLKAIIAHNKLGFIGLNGTLPWRSREDLKHFKDLTLGSKLLVGYNTYKNLPPLKDRELIIDDRYELIDTKNIDWCIGGKKTYEKYCHLFTELHVSIINDETIGDTIYPNLKNLNPNCKIIYYNFHTDKELIEIYMTGFKDELNGAEKKYLEDETMNYAYLTGRQDAIIGDDIRSSDYQSNNEIIKRIINKKC